MGKFWETLNCTNYQRLSHYIHFLYVFFTAKVIERIILYPPTACYPCLDPCFRDIELDASSIGAAMKGKLRFTWLDSFSEMVYNTGNTEVGEA